jgi:hypothetical protein
MDPVDSNFGFAVCAPVFVRNLVFDNGGKSVPMDYRFRFLHGKNAAKKVYGEARSYTADPETGEVRSPCNSLEETAASVDYGFAECQMIWLRPAFARSRSMLRRLCVRGFSECGLVWEMLITWLMRMQGVVGQSRQSRRDWRVVLGRTMEPRRPLDATPRRRRLALCIVKMHAAWSNVYTTALHQWGLA